LLLDAVEAPVAVPVAFVDASADTVIVEPACVAVTTTVAATELAEAWLYAPWVKPQAEETDFRSF
jgi:hypothetical protein